MQDFYHQQNLEFEVSSFELTSNWPEVVATDKGQ